MVNSIRFSGIASGMDTQAIVDALMQAERIPLNKIQQNKQILEWKRDDYRSMNLLLKELDDFIFNGIYRKSNMTTKTVVSSNNEFISATASANASNISYQIEKVKLATAARKISDKETGIDPSKSLWSQIGGPDSPFDWQSEEIENTFTVPENSNGEFQLNKRDIDFEFDKIEVGGKEFTVRTSPITTENPLGNNEVFIDKSSGKLKFGSDIESVAAGSTFTVKFTNHYLEFDVKTYNERGDAQYKYFKFDGSTSLNSMFSTINSANAGINLFYDEGSDRVVATRTETGNFNINGNEIEFLMIKRDAEGNIVRDETTEQRNAFFADVLGLKEDVPNTGTDASFTINGLETTRKSNTFTIDGVTFTLKKNSVINGVDTGESATINIQNNTDEIVKTITDFVNKYNEIIGKINEKISEERYRDYKPLTDEEKDALSEDEIKKWEEKARSGLLRRDQILTSALDKLRMDLYTEVTANDVTRTDINYNQFAEIGITTTKNYFDRGKLEINEDKLRTAIEENPEAIYQLFMADGEGYSERGLARRLRDTISSTIKTIEERAGNSYKTAYSYTMGRQLLDYEEQIRRFEERLASKENQYWKQFTAMEKAMQELNNQSNMLYSYLGMAVQ